MPQKAGLLVEVAWRGSEEYVYDGSGANIDILSRCVTTIENALCSLIALNLTLSSLDLPAADLSSHHATPATGSSTEERLTYLIDVLSLDPIRLTSLSECCRAQEVPWTGLDFPREPPAWHRWVEIAGQLLFLWTWFGHGLLWCTTAIVKVVIPSNNTRHT